MTAIDTYILDYDSHDSQASARRSLLVSVLSCLFIAGMFMLATNDPRATAMWEGTTRTEVSNLSITMESGRSVRQVAFLALGAWGAISLFLSRRQFRIDGVYFFPLVTLIGWAFLSILWTNDHGFTAKRLVLLACVGLAVVAFVRQFKVRDLALLALVGGGLQMAGNIVFDLLYATGSYGKSGYRFSGLQHPNHAGITAMLVIMACLYYFERTRLWRYLLILCFFSVIMFMTKSRSSLIAGLFAIALFGMIRWNRRTLVLLALGGLAVAGLFSVMVSADLVADDWSNIIHMGREDSQAAALTGRPQIWDAALEVLGRNYSRLLLGVGYDSFWTPETALYVSNRVWFRISEGHCAYFDTLLELGIVGVVSYLFLVIGSAIRYARLAWVNDNPSYAFAMMIFVFVFVHGLTESTTVDPNFGTFFSFSAMAFLALRSPRMLTQDDEVLL